MRYISGHNPPSTAFKEAGRGKRRGTGERMKQLKALVEERLDECQVWSWATDGKGYGMLAHEGKVLLAHRAAYELVNGPIPSGLELHHTCDTPLCVNPNHLLAVTRIEHMTLDGRATA